MASLVETEVIRQLDELAAIRAEDAHIPALLKAQEERISVAADIIKRLAVALIVADSLIEDPQQRLTVFAVLRRGLDDAD